MESVESARFRTWNQHKEQKRKAVIQAKISALDYAKYMYTYQPKCWVTLLSLLHHNFRTEKPHFLRFSWVVHLLPQLGWMYLSVISAQTTPLVLVCKRTREQYNRTNLGLFSISVLAQLERTFFFCSKSLWCQCETHQWSLSSLFCRALLKMFLVSWTSFFWVVCWQKYGQISTVFLERNLHSQLLMFCPYLGFTGQ